MTRIFQVDAFTDRPFRGNPAAVCLLESARPDWWLQAVAAEMGCSETAFLERDGGTLRLRWFTPVTEVDLCGHATLATAHVLFGTRPDLDRLAFETRSGVLGARRSPEGIELDFPAQVATAVEPPPGLIDALGVTPVWVGRNATDLLVEVADAASVTSITPDYPALRSVGVRGVMVTAPGEKGGAADFVSRFFAPGVGIDEDPVTGSAHCCLGPHWARRLGRTRLRAYQASPRGGWLTVETSGDRVHLVGKAVTVLEGQLGDATAP